MGTSWAVVGVLMHSGPLSGQRWSVFVGVCARTCIRAHTQIYRCLCTYNTFVFTSLYVERHEFISEPRFLSNTTGFVPVSPFPNW